MVKQYVILFTVLCAFIILMPHRAMSSPVVNIPKELDAQAGSKIDIPITISGVSNADIGGYALRIDFDETMLSNPTIISDGTLSEGNSNLNIFHHPADGIGKLSVGIGFNFRPENDGTLIIVQFDVSNDFSTKTLITFAGSGLQSNIFTAGFNPIDTIFENGAIVPKISEKIHLSLPLNLKAECGGQVVIPVMITNETGVNIAGYTLRLNYDKSLLSNPFPVVSETFSDGNNNLETVLPPVDGIGNYSIGMFGLNIHQSGTLIKVKFDVSSECNNEPTMIGFAGKNSKTTLFQNGFEKVNAAFQNGFEKVNAAFIDGSLFSEIITEYPCLYLNNLSKNDKVSLKDVISGLQVITGIRPPEINVLKCSSDIDNDQHIGIEEVIFVMMKLSSMDK